MPTRAAGKNPDVLKTLPLLGREGNIFKMNPIGVERKPSQNRVADGGWLFVNFLQHEMLEAAFFSKDGIPRDVLELWFALFPAGVKKPNSITSHDRNFVLVKKKDRPCVRNKGGNIGSDEAFAIHAADDNRCSFADGYDLLRIVSRHHRECKQAFQFRERLQDGLFQISPKVLLDQVGDNFRIGFGSEPVAFLGK